MEYHEQEHNDFQDSAYYINRIAYAAETGKQIRADTGTIVLVDDPQTHAMGLLRGIEVGTVRRVTF